MAISSKSKSESGKPWVLPKFELPPKKKTQAPPQKTEAELHVQSGTNEAEAQAHQHPHPEKPTALEIPLSHPTLKDLEELARLAQEDGFARGQEEGYAHGQNEGYAHGQNEGYAKGHEEGFAHGLMQAQSLVDRLIGIVENLRKPLEHLDGEVTEALVRLAIEVAGVLVRQSYSADPAKVVELVKEAIASLPSGPRALEIRLNPDDVAAVAPILTPMFSGEPARIVADAALKSGDVRIHADHVRIDASIATRLEEAAKVLLAAGTKL